jgi:hypothetical protein
LKADLTALLKSIPIQQLHRASSIEALPPAILTDLRYISLRPQIRDPMIEAYIDHLPFAPDQADISPEEEAELAKQRQERQRREAALAEREKRVQEDKRRQKAALHHSKGMLREGEDEIQRAMRVSKEGLLGHFAGDTGEPAPNVDSANTAVE